MTKVTCFHAVAILGTFIFLLSMLHNDGKSCVSAAPTAAPRPGGGAAGGAPPARPGGRMPPRRLGIVVPGGGPGALPGPPQVPAPGGGHRPRGNAVVVNPNKNPGK
ncbi:hypothetical protein MTO96_034427 [Rhipicephalus appendiculatus]